MIKFNILWEECAQEEARMTTREEKLGDDEDQTLATRTRKCSKPANKLYH